ncbi:MAG: DUF4136 domain-containing protein [Burkholderiaceae bacterium]
MKRTLGALLFVVLLLAGCATTRLVDSEVRSFSSLPATPTSAAYRFERLPSQQSYGDQQAQLEAMAQQALAKVGLQRDDSAAKYSVQIGAHAQREIRYSYDPWWPGWGPGWGPHWRGHGSMFWHHPFPPYSETRLYKHQVSLVLRDLASSQLVYETHAVHDGLWADSAAIWPVMFEAALSGFPNPPPGVRRVNIEIPR